MLSEAKHLNRFQSSAVKNSVRFFASLRMTLLFACVVVAAAYGKNAPPVRLMPGLGEVYHPVSTKSREAQAFFDQGLKLVYGFNHDEARKSFERAAEIDPKLAMAWWGVALTLGPNYNLPVDPEREKAGYDAVQKAIALKQNASDLERAYIDALAVRYSNDPKADLHALDVAYKDAMAKLVARYPDDLDAATLYAESMMNLNPWHLWTADGKPAEGTNEIVATLESVLKRDPNHLGANHYYIHAVEASPNPERALPSAARLEKLAPAAGHLMHMPAHIYARVGDHAASAHCNMLAAAADKKYIADTHATGVYPLMYYSHNLDFLAYADCMRGNFAEAKSAADKLVANVMPGIKEMPMLEGFLPTPMIVLFAFERWNDLAKLPAPNPALKITTAVWHAFRGIAFASLGKTDEAEKERKMFADLIAQIPPDIDYSPLNKTGSVFKVHENLLAAAIALSMRDTQRAIASLKEAVAAEDALNYDEPPDWYPPVRPTLGRALLEANQVADAEKVFRADLDRNPRNARALTGLRDCLRTQKRNYEADQIDREFHEVWKVADAEDATAKSKP